jgi:4-hydroxy-3-polyprenylbenzoate decarboxylase
MNKRKIVLGIGGSSGSIYAKRIIDKLAYNNLEVEVGIVMSDNAKINWEIELGTFDKDNIPFKIYGKNDFNAPFASGSAKYDTMIICPCSMGLLGRIANGLSSDLMTRSADVILKERRKLIIVPRETPYNLIHIENMKTLTLAGAIICPATPSFYSKPSTIEELIDTVVDRILDLAGFDLKTYRWGES